MTFRLPGLDERVTINGRTGSGKSVFGAWLLSRAPFHKMPYVIVDLKGDDLLTSIERVHDIGFEVPKRPGLYRLHAEVGDDDGMNRWLDRVLARGGCGIHIDEGYLLPARSLPFQRVLAVGRSRKVPVTTLTQRPSWVSRYVFSEADYYVTFDLNDKRDRDTVSLFTPSDHPVWDMDFKLPKHTSRWYDVKRHVSAHLGAVPAPDRILTYFDERLRPRKRLI